MPETTATTEAQSTSGVAGIVQSFGLRGDIFLAQLVNFTIVFVVLWRFAYKPIMRFVHDREELIAKSVDDAKRIGERVQQLETESASMLAVARSDAQKLIERAAKDADARKAEAVESAKAEVANVIRKGKEQLEQEKNAMILAARKDIVDIAVRAAAKIVMDGMTEKKAQSLAEEMVRKLT